MSGQTGPTRRAPLRVLITGGSGQLGGQLVKALSERGHQTIAPTRAELDVTNHPHFGQVISAEAPHVIVNCAAVTNVDWCEAHPDEATRINSELPKFLANEAKSIDSFFVQISTDFVFDGASSTPYRETDVTAPCNVYGQSKLDGETLGEHIAVLRTAWLLSRSANSFLSKVLSAGSAHASFPVVDDQFGSPTGVTDLALAIVEIVERRIDGLHHLAGPAVVSRHELAQQVLTAFGLDKDLAVAITTDSLPKSPARRPTYTALDSGLLGERSGLLLREHTSVLDDLAAVTADPDTSAAP